MRADRLQTLFRQAPPAIVLSVVVAVMVCVALWDVTDRRILTTWLEFLGLLAAARIGIVATHARRRTDTVLAPKLEGWFVGSTIVVALVWGAGGWLLMPETSLAHQATLYFFLLGLAGGAVATYGAEATLVTVTLSLVVLPATARLLTFDSLLLRLMALGGFIFTLAAYRATALLSASIERSHQLSYELAIANARAQELARTDDLTGLNNRRAFLEIAAAALTQASRYGRPIALILLDVDRFKAVNDAHGHGVGDDVLRALADVLRSTVRASDVVGRMGGEEFAILLPETTVEDAAGMAERVRAAIADRPVASARGVVRFTASFGVAERDAQPSVEALIGRADAALYEAKRDGRDRVRRSAPS